MTDAELQELSPPLERLKRSNRHWKALTAVLGVPFLLLLSLALVGSAALDRHLARAFQAEARERAAMVPMRRRMADEQRRAEQAEARRRGARGAKALGDEARPQRPAGDKPQGP
jgi:hypothetical protein